MGWTWVTDPEEMWRGDGVPITFNEGDVVRPPTPIEGFFGWINVWLDAGSDGIFPVNTYNPFAPDPTPQPDRVWGGGAPMSGTLFYGLEPSDPDGNPIGQDVPLEISEPDVMALVVRVTPVTPPAPEPVFLRHAPRHVHHTVANLIEAKMTELNWKDPAATPLGAPILRFQKEAALAGGRSSGVDKISPGLVSITLGDEAPSLDEELGGPLRSQEYPIFVDVFMGTDGEATAVASDVRDILLGRFPGTKRVISVVDQSTGTPVDGWLVELDDVERARPSHTYQVHWQVVKVTAVAYFDEVAY